MSPPFFIGTVEWPEPKKGALDGIRLLRTGVFETITGDDLDVLMRKCGAWVYSGMSKNLDYLLVGRDAGPMKIKMANEMGIPQLAEEEFYNFITDKIKNYDPEVVADTAEKLATARMERAKNTHKPKSMKVKKEQTTEVSCEEVTTHVLRANELNIKEEPEDNSVEEPFQSTSRRRARTTHIKAEEDELPVRSTRRTRLLESTEPKIETTKSSKASTSKKVKKELSEEKPLRSSLRTTRSSTN
jgi:hypothetical protein